LATYLTVVARRVVVRAISKRRMAEALGHVPAHQSSLAQAHAVPHEEQRVEDVEEVKRLLAKLPSPDADVVRKFHLEGRSYREISSQLGIPENTIGPTLSRAREKMRQQDTRS